MTAQRDRPETNSPETPIDALVVYGTSRGSTGQLAEAIANGLESAGASASAVSIDLVEMMPARIQRADVLGIGCPVYFLREPRYITDFLSGLGPLDGKRAFVFCSCGMDRVGETLIRLSDQLRERGAVVVGAQHFRSAMSYAPYRRRGFGNSDELPDGAEFAAARAFGERMAQARELEPFAVKPVSRSTELKARLLANRRFRWTFFPRPQLDRVACTGYGSCLSRCLFNALEREGDESIPDVTDDCIQCLECIPTCPRTAIAPDSRFREWFSTLSYRLKLH